MNVFCRLKRGARKKRAFLEARHDKQIKEAWNNDQRKTKELLEKVYKGQQERAEKKRKGWTPGLSTIKGPAMQINQKNPFQILLRGKAVNQSAGDLLPLSRRMILHICLAFPQSG